MISKLYVVFLVLLACMSSVLAVQTLPSYSFDTHASNSAHAFNEVVRSDSAIIQLNTDVSGLSCRYSTTKSQDFLSMEGTFDFSYQSTHRKIFTGLSDGNYKYYVKCRDVNGTVSSELELSFSVITPVTARISLSQGSPVGAGVLKVKLITSKLLSQKPTLTYSTDGKTYDPVPLSGSNDEWEGYIIIPDTMQSAVGSFKFRGSDIEGNTGEEITEGAVFLIDTLKPGIIYDLTATSSSSEVKLTWRFNEEVAHYAIYRSTFPDPDYSDYYQKTSSKSYTDRDVDRGKTYYYKINAVDKAGNEGELSVEVSSAPLQSSSTGSTIDDGLPNELIALVDSTIYDVENVRDEIPAIRSKYGTTSKESGIYTDLKLTIELDNANTEISSILEELESYKGQSLSRTELDKKISNSKLRLNVVKKKIPESVYILNELSFDAKPDESAVQAVLLALANGQEDPTQSQKLKKSTAFNEQLKFSTKTQAYNLEIAYLDGSKKKMSLVSHALIKDDSSNTNFSIIEYIPKEIAEKASDLTIKNINYEVLKDDPILSFNIAEEEILYVLEKNMDLNLLKNIRTLALYTGEDSPESTNPLTGYFSLVDQGIGNGFGAIFIVLALVIVAGIYYSRKSKKEIDSLQTIGDKLLEARAHLKNRNIPELEKIYGEISLLYRELGDSEKKLIYPKLDKLHSDILSLGSYNGTTS